MAINIYPVTEMELQTKNYEVKINGMPVKLDTARVSAMPFCRRWPGYQRDKNQTELINFLSFATNETVHFEITPKNSFEKVMIRPQSLGIEPVVENGTISFDLDKPAYFTVEPYGRHDALHIFADPISDYNIDFNNDNVLYFGAGEHDVGQITLKSNQTLFLDEGAVVYTCIQALDAENIKIIGRGILDNSRNKAQILYECSATENNTVQINNAVRQHTIQLEYCTNIEINGITIRDSLVYNIRPVGCKNLHISNVKIIGCWRYNSDGIDMHNCENVFIDNCFLRTFDDSLCVKGFDCYYDGDVEQAVHEAMYRNGKAYDVFKNVRVKNCTIWNDFGKCLEIGAETKAEEIFDVVFEDCNIIHVTWQPLDCCNVDYADVHDITYQNINIEYDDYVPNSIIQKSDDEVYKPVDIDWVPWSIYADITYHPEYSVGSTRRGIIRNIIFRNIRLYGRHAPRVCFVGYDEEHKVKDVLIENIYWNDELVTEFGEDCFTLEKFTENICYRVTES